MKSFKEFINETEIQKATREKIKREKEADRIKHDRMMDAARRRDTVVANQKEERMDEEVEFHVRLDHLDGDKRQKKANDVLRKHEKAGHINFHGETDKGIVFKAKSKQHADRLHRELRPHATGVDMNEACWDGYKRVGMKKKGKKMVPNCVPE